VTKNAAKKKREWGGNSANFSHGAVLVNWWLQVR